MDSTKKDVTKLTRAQAERLAAQTTDLEVLKNLKTHKNKHVTAKATRKIARLKA